MIVRCDMAGGNKELLLAPDAIHTNLHDNFDKIPFDRIEVVQRKPA